jgi:site-specific DNA recombinase
MGIGSGGERLCRNKQVRADVLEAAVWDDVCGLLQDPDRLAAEYQRRLDEKTAGPKGQGRAQTESLIQKVQRGIGRLIDAYGEGLVDKEEFEPRIRAFKERLARLEEQAKQQAQLESQEQDLRLVIGRLQDFAERIRGNMAEADWTTRREIIRTLVKRIEIDGDEVRVVYRVDLAPFAEGPQRGLLPDCRSHWCAPSCGPIRARTRWSLPSLARTALSLAGRDPGEATRTLLVYYPTESVTRSFGSGLSLFGGNNQAWT